MHHVTGWSRDPCAASSQQRSLPPLSTHHPKAWIYLHLWRSFPSLCSVHHRSAGNRWVTPRLAAQISLPRVAFQSMPVSIRRCQFKIDIDKSLAMWLERITRNLSNSILRWVALFWDVNSTFKQGQSHLNTPLRRVMDISITSKPLTILFRFCYIFLRSPKVVIIVILLVTRTWFTILVEYACTKRVYEWLSDLYYDSVW